MISLRLHSLAYAALAVAIASSGPALADDQGQNAAAKPNRVTLQMDFIGAAYLPALKRMVVTGLHGLVGTIEVTDQGAKLTTVAKHPDEDFTALAKVSDSEVMIGSAKGRVYSFDGTTITELGELSKYHEPVLWIAAHGNDIWVVGARGLVAHSSDGKKFENVEIRDVTQPLATFPGGQPADWYMGVSNIDTDTVQFHATIKGKPAQKDTDYTLYPDEGFIQVANQLDESPAPTVSFKFNPGPAFRAGDVTWNVVLVQPGGKITLAGEFGMILQSGDNGKTWVRRNIHIVPHEPESPYWMAGTAHDQEMWLVGAAGANSYSNDGGATWTDNTKPGTEGIFGVHISAKGTPVIAGAVGLIGTLQGTEWKLADRTRLHLLSWLKTLVPMPDGSLIATGGRTTLIRYKDGTWTRIPVERQQQ